MNDCMFLLDLFVDRAWDSIARMSEHDRRWRIPVLAICKTPDMNLAIERPAPAQLVMRILFKRGLMAAYMLKILELTPFFFNGGADPRNTKLEDKVLIGGILLKHLQNLPAVIFYLLLLYNWYLRSILPAP